MGTWRTQNNGSKAARGQYRECYNHGMSHQLPAALMAACLIVIPATLTACDGADVESPDLDGLVLASPDGAEPADVSFREPGPANGIYITKWKGQEIRRDQFVLMVKSCFKYGDPKLTCTFSWYDPDTSTGDDHVVGLGCSAKASTAYVGCFLDLFNQNGGTPL